MSFLKKSLVDWRPFQYFLSFCFNVCCPETCRPKMFEWNPGHIHQRGWGHEEDRSILQLESHWTSSFQNSNLITLEMDQIIIQTFHFVAFQVFVGDLMIFSLPKFMLGQEYPEITTPKHQASKACLTLTYASCEPPWQQAVRGRNDSKGRWFFWTQSQTIHVWYTCTYMYHSKNKPNMISKYTYLTWMKLEKTDFVKMGISLKKDT